MRDWLDATLDSPLFIVAWFLYIGLCALVGYYLTRVVRRCLVRRRG